MPHLRQDQAEIHVGVAGVVNAAGVNFPSYVWQSLDGGDVQANTLNAHPGGFLNAYSLGGPAKRNDATVKRLYGADPSGRSLHDFVGPLETACGTARMWISYTPLDADGNHNGQTVTLTGTLKQVQHPNWDANTSGAAQLTLVMDCDLNGPIA